MKLPLELLLLISPALAAPLTPRPASPPHLRGLTPLARDHSAADSRFPDKHFHEATFHPHYDGRFAAEVLPPPTRAFHMRLLLRSYMAAMRRAGVRTWLMHGSLLGWWWNGGMFPWDSDLDVCVLEAGIGELGSWWNMTVHGFTGAELGLRDGEPGTQQRVVFPWDRGSDEAESEVGEAMYEAQSPGLADGVWKHVVQHGKKYLLEVNPHYTNTSTSDKRNVIDARWIDTSTGLFIDITTVHPVPSTPSPSVPKHQKFLAPADTPDPAAPPHMYTKDTHLYNTTSLFPLRHTTFEGTSVCVPYAYEALLLEEYGPRALVETWFNSYEFHADAREWVVAPGGSSMRVGKGRGDREDAAGRGRKGGRRPKWRPVHGKTDAGLLDNVDATGEKAYTPVAGKEGDVHVVPGGGE